MKITKQTLENLIKEALDTMVQEKEEEEEELIDVEAQAGKPGYDALGRPLPPGEQYGERLAGEPGSQRREQALADLHAAMKGVVRYIQTQSGEVGQIIAGPYGKPGPK